MAALPCGNSKSGHIAIDPDSEVITKTTATAGNAGDAATATDLLTEDLPAETAEVSDDEAGNDGEDRLKVYGDAA